MMPMLQLRVVVDETDAEITDFVETTHIYIYTYIHICIAASNESCQNFPNMRLG